MKGNRNAVKDTIGWSLIRIRAEFEMSNPEMMRLLAHTIPSFAVLNNDGRTNECKRQQAAIQSLQAAICELFPEKENS